MQPRFGGSWRRTARASIASDATAAANFFPLAAKRKEAAIPRDKTKKFIAAVLRCAPGVNAASAIAFAL
jgi:hypothetical protein